MSHARSTQTRTSLVVALSLTLGVSSARAGVSIEWLHPGVIEKTKARVASGDPALRPAFEQLRGEAEAALKKSARSVMEKRRTAASGDKHDYFSYGPYWWPNPAKADGLPYLRRDGETNPDALNGTDYVAFRALNDDVQTLGLAYFLLGDERHAARAAALVRAWFLEPATRMNPNLRHAQAIPGINDGRGTGIIETRHLQGVLEGVAFIFDSPAWTKRDDKGFREWLEAYYRWLRTSPNGVDEAAAKNNHGTWYDVQVARLALVLGHREEAKDLIAHALPHRISTQIEPDGRQPLELARTKPLNYCILNLEGLIQLATMAEHLRIDGWAVRTADGRSLEKALRVLVPYLDPEKARTAGDIVPVSRERLFLPLVEALRHVPAPDLEAALARYATAEQNAARWQLFR